MEDLSKNPLGSLRTTLNGHIHSLLYAACAFLYEVLLNGPEANAVWRERSRSHLYRVIELLESMADYRPTAAQAIKNLVSTLDQTQARQAPRTDTSSDVLAAGITDGELSLDELLAWPQDGLDAFLFSSQQYLGAELGNTAAEVGADNTWFSTAMLFQSQGHWSSFTR